MKIITAPLRLCGSTLVSELINLDALYREFPARLYCHFG